MLTPRPKWQAHQANETEEIIDEHDPAAIKAASDIIEETPPEGDPK